MPQLLLVLTQASSAAEIAPMTHAWEAGVFCTVLALYLTVALVVTPLPNDGEPWGLLELMARRLVTAATIALSAFASGYFFALSGAAPLMDVIWGVLAAL